MEIITLPVGGVNKLASDFKVSRQAVSRALRGRTTSSFAQMLRKAALERGGRLYKDVTDFIPSCETTFDTANCIMEQSFGRDVRVYFDLTSGNAEVYADGVLHSMHSDVTFKNIGEVQKEAQHLADELINTNN